MESETVKEITIVIGRDFTRTPIGRYVSDGVLSGEVFREKKLIPALKEFDRVTVDLAGVVGYGSSFLEEAFGGLFSRDSPIDPDVVWQKLRVITTDESKQQDLEDVNEYMREQFEQVKGK